MNIITQVSLEDNLRGAFFFVYSRPTMIIIYAVSFLLGAALLFGYLNDVHMDGDGVYIIEFLIIYLILILPLNVYFRTKKQYKSNKNLQKPITYEFTDEKIELTGDELASSFLWKNVYMVRESKNLFYIYQSKAIANIIPKRFFSSEEEAEFRNLVKRTGVKSKLKKNL